MDVSDLAKRIAIASPKNGRITRRTYSDPPPTYAAALRRELESMRALAKLLEMQLLEM